MKLSKLANRIMFLSPTVQAGWENQSYRSDFQNLATLGQGSYGTVWKAKHKKTGAIYAIKQIRKKSITSQKMIDHVRTEVKIMYCLNHPYIIKLYNHFQDQFSIYFVLQYAEKGELYKALMKTQTKRFQQSIAAKYISQVVMAIQYVHKLNIIHRDIKPQNILISKEDDLKLADFGWSNFNSQHNKRETYCGTLDYLAPEMVQESHLHDYRVDVWSIGVLIYELCTGSSPFSSQLIKTNNLSEAAVKTNIRLLNYKMPGDLSPACRDLITKILVLNPEDRLSLDGILNHSWITKTNKSLNEDWSKDKWLTKLKHQFGAVLQTKEEEVKKYEAFSKDEIYNCVRLESVINAFSKQKTGEQGEKKHRELELRIKQLELCNRRQEEELKFLRNIKNQHQQCGMELIQARQTSKAQTKKIQSLSMKLQDYERIIKEYQKSTHR